jgi:hypothetical protein
MLLETIVALPIAVVLRTPGCEIGVWADITARLRGGPASSPICIIGLHTSTSGKPAAAHDQQAATTAEQRRDVDHHRVTRKGGTVISGNPELPQPNPALSHRGRDP